MTLLTWLNRRCLLIENTWSDDQLYVRLVNKKEALTLLQDEAGLGQTVNLYQVDRLINYSLPGAA